MVEYRFPDSRILVFAKAPVIGQVKTRMQAALSERQCLELYQQMLNHCLQQLSQSRLAPVELWVTGDHPHWERLSQHYEFRLCFQQGDDLGQRMAHALNESLSYSESVVVIGTDCPFMASDYLEEAFISLAESSPVVVGPALDGGYVLIGLRQFSTRLFEGIPWGSDQVLARTLQQISDLGWPCSVLAGLADIDRPEDLDHLRMDFPQLLPVTAS
jgi:rSAM/selenodomain-associated transferase 1